MFKIETDPQFTHTVAVLTPVDGGHRRETFRARFKLQPAEVVERYRLLAGGSDVREFLEETVTHLYDLVDDDENPIPYSEELKARVLSNYGACLALLNTYLDAVVKAKVGNSDGSDAPGPRAS